MPAPVAGTGLVCPHWQVRMHPSGERAVFDLGLLAGETRHPYRLQCEQQVYCELLEARLAVMRHRVAATAPMDDESREAS